MAGQLDLVTNVNYATPGSSAGWFRVSEKLSGTYSFSDLWNALFNATSFSSSNNGRKDNVFTTLNYVCTAGCDYNGGIAHWTSNLRSVLHIVLESSDNIAIYHNNVEGKHVDIKMYFVRSTDNFKVYFYHFNKVMPAINDTATHKLISDTCFEDLWLLESPCDRIYSRGSVPGTVYIESQIIEDSPCTDLRSSTITQTVKLTFYNYDTSVSCDINFGLTSTSQTLSIYDYLSNDDYYRLLMMFTDKTSINNVRCSLRFIGGSVRGNCTIALKCVVHGMSLGMDTLGTVPVWKYDSIEPITKDIFSFDFVPCNDFPNAMHQGNLMSFIDGLNFDDRYCLWIDTFRMVVSPVSALSNYCCDDVVPSDDDTISIEPITNELYFGFGSGGGDDVNIQCICDNLATINNTLVAFKESNSSALASIDEAIQNISIEGGTSSCICDNLENIADGVIAIKEAIDDKELSVVNNNNVQPPVNNISVQPPINNISLPTTQLEDIATNTRALNCVCSSLQNLEVIEQGTKESIDGVKFNLQCGKDDNISCILDNVNSNVSNIANSLVCGNDGIACVLKGKEISVDVDLNTADITNGLDTITEKLDDINSSVHDGLFNSDDESNLQNISKSLNTSDDESKSLADVLTDSLNTSDDESKSLADVINDKEMGTNIDVEVSPADDVNINRVYYTNQRNGETNI